MALPAKCRRSPLADGGRLIVIPVILDQPAIAKTGTHLSVLAPPPAPAQGQALQAA
jgi:hypothetical protein